MSLNFRAPTPDEVTIQVVEQWLVKNGYVKSDARLCYEKIFSNLPSFSRFNHDVLWEDIIATPKNVVKNVEDWHKFHQFFYAPFDWDDSDATKQIDFAKKKEDEQTWCNHDWVKYTGLNETFQFCKKCDKRRDK